jgi:hypothetical protein
MIILLIERGAEWKDCHLRRHGRWECAGGRVGAETAGQEVALGRADMHR